MIPPKPPSPPPPLGFNIAASEGNPPPPLPPSPSSHRPRLHPIIGRDAALRPTTGALAHMRGPGRRRHPDPPP